MQRIANLLRFWMLGVLVAGVAVLEVADGTFQGARASSMAAPFVFFSALTFAVIRREGQPMGPQRVQHGRNPRPLPVSTRSHRPDTHPSTVEIGAGNSAWPVRSFGCVIPGIDDER